MIDDILSYLGLSHNPFPVALDPNNYYQTEATKVFLEELVHGIESRKGFLVLIGDVGVGKTSLSLQLLKLLEEKRVSTAWVFNTVFDKEELFHAILKDWGMTVPPGTSGPTLLDAIHDFLLDENRNDQNCVIIIDEAHNLDQTCLEGLRMLSNLEFNGQKLVQILLIGQDELKLALDDHRMRQLRSRIAIYLEHPSLSKDEVQGYVNFKLAKADSQLRLDGRGLNILYQATGGNLRRVNLIMERALYACITLRKTQITPKAVTMAVMDVAAHQKDVARGLGRRRLKWALAACLVLGLAGGAAFAWLQAHGKFDNTSAQASITEQSGFAEDAGQTALSAPEGLGLGGKPTPIQEPAAPLPNNVPEKSRQEPAPSRASISPTPERSDSLDKSPSASPPTAVPEASSPTPQPGILADPLAAFGLGAIADKAEKAASSGSIRALQQALPQGYTAFEANTDYGPGGPDWISLPWNHGGPGPKWVVIWRNATDYASVFPGSNGPEVRKLQTLLARRGLYTGPRDGIFGKKAWYALAEYQKQNGLTPNGLPDPATVFHLEHDAATAQ